MTFPTYSSKSSKILARWNLGKWGLTPMWTYTLTPLYCVGEWSPLRFKSSLCHTQVSLLLGLFIFQQVAMPLLYGSPQLDYNQRSSYTQEWKTRDAQHTRVLYTSDKLTDNHFIQTPHYYRQFALFLGKESPYIFSPFNLLNTDTFCGPPSVRINRVWPQ